MNEPDKTTQRLEQYIDDLRHNSERKTDLSFDTETAKTIANELEQIIEHDHSN